MNNPSWIFMLYGLLGAVLSELIRLKKALDEGKSWNSFSWISLVITLVIAAIAVWLGQPADALKAAGIGFAAPAFLTGLLGSKDKNAGIVNPRGPTSIRDWWFY